jgi:hypothetical protein
MEQKSLDKSFLFSHNECQLLRNTCLQSLLLRLSPALFLILDLCLCTLVLAGCLVVQDGIC